MRWLLKLKSKKMRWLLKISICLCLWNGFSQNTFEKTPENFKEIHFVYEVQSNYIVNDEGVFADTLLFKTDFPDLKYTTKKHPKDSTLICGFTTLKELGKENTKKLASIIYHTNETFNAVYNTSKKKTVFNVIRYDEQTRNIFKKHFKESYFKFQYKKEFDFIKKIRKLIYPAVLYNHSFSEISKKIEPANDDLIGFFYETKGNVLFKNIVYFNKDLSKDITPLIFENINFGIEKIETVQKTIKLKSVHYK